MKWSTLSWPANQLKTLPEHELMSSVATPWRTLPGLLVLPRLTPACSSPWISIKSVVSAWIPEVGASGGAFGVGDVTQAAADAAAVMHLFFLVELSSATCASQPPCLISDGVPVTHSTRLAPGLHPQHEKCNGEMKEKWPGFWQRLLWNKTCGEAPGDIRDQFCGKSCAAQVTQSMPTPRTGMNKCSTLWIENEYRQYKIPHTKKCKLHGQAKRHRNDKIMSW